jgi:hypothetical protein
MTKFDKVIALVDRAPGLPALDRIERRKQLQAARTDFERKGTFPSDDDFAGIELEYYLKINSGAVPVSLMIDEVIEKGSRKKNDDLEKRGLKMKEALEEKLGGASRLVGRSVWEGQLFRSDGKTIPYRLEVEMGKGGSFKGHVEENPGVAGNRYDVEGQTRVLGVKYEMSKSLRGNLIALSGDGIVSGDRLIANIALVEGIGTPAVPNAVPGRIVLKRVK